MAGVGRRRPDYKRHPGEGARLRRRRVERQQPPAQGNRPQRQLPRQRDSRPRQPPLLPPQRPRDRPEPQRARPSTRCSQRQPVGQRRRLPLHGWGEAGRRHPRGDGRKSCWSSCLRALCNGHTCSAFSEGVTGYRFIARFVIMSSGTNDFSSLHYLGPRGFLSDSETTSGAFAYHSTWTFCLNMVGHLKINDV